MIEWDPAKTSVPEDAKILHLPTPEQTPPVHYPEQHRGRLRELGRTCGKLALKGAAVTAVAMAIGAGSVMKLPTSVSIGAGDIDATPTLNGEATVHMGIGSISKATDSVMGVNITPRTILGGEGDSPHQSVAADLEEYAALLSNLDENKEKEAIQAAVLEHARDNTIYWGYPLTLAGLGLIGAARRKEHWHSIAYSRSLHAALAFGTFMAPMAVMTAAEAAQNHPKPNISPAFADTPLEGTTIKGHLLKRLVNDYGSEVVSYFRANKQFYSSLLVNFERARESQPLLSASDDTITLLHVTDQHCNMNMNKPIASVARAADVDQLANTGDSVIGGTPLDAMCTNSYNQALKDRARIVADGNHRSLDTAEIERKNGELVLDGKVIEVGGLRYLGAPEQRISLFGEAIEQVGPETNKQVGQRLADIACSDPKGVDIIMAANQDAVMPTLQRGCAKLGLAGGRFNEELVWVDSADGQRLPMHKGGGVGGVVDNDISLGLLKKPAKMSLIQLDKFSHRPLREQTITFNTDGNVVIGPIVALATETTAQNTPPPVQ